MFNAIKKMFGLSDHLKLGMEKTSLNKYDIALILLCKLYRININKQKFFSSSAISSVNLPESNYSYDQIESQLISVLYNNISSRRNHHIIFFQYIVKLLSNIRTITPRRIKTYNKIGSILVKKLGSKKVTNYVESWTNLTFLPCFNVYYDSTTYYRTFATNYYNSYNQINQIEREHAYKAIYTTVKADKIWYIWNYDTSWFDTWFIRFDWEKSSRQQSNDWDGNSYNNEYFNNKYTRFSKSNNTLEKCYKILEIKPTSDKTMIKIAYRKLCLKYHPDKGGSHEKFIKLNQSYEYLMTHV